MKEYRRDPIDDELVEVEVETDSNQEKKDKGKVIKVEEKDQQTKKDDDTLDIDDLFQVDSPEEFLKELEKLQRESPRPKNLKVINFPQRLSYNLLLNTIYLFLINVMIIFSLLGYTKVVDYKSMLDVLFYALIFSGVEILTKEVLYYYKPMWIFKSLGSILLAVTVLSFLVADVTLKNINFTSTSALVFFIVVFLIVRSLLINIIVNKRIENFFKGGRRHG